MMTCGLPSASTTWARLDPFAQVSTLSQVECDMCVQALLSPQLDTVLSPFECAHCVQATLYPQTNVTQDSTLSHNEFALCLRALLRPSLALSPYEFSACMRALISSPFSHAPAEIRQYDTGTRQHGSHTSRTIRRFMLDNVPHLDAPSPGYLQFQIPRIIEYPDDILLASPPQNFLYPQRVIEYSDDILFVFPRQNLLYPPAPVPDTIIITVVVVSVWVVLFM